MENVQLIAEVGQAHDGSLGILHSFIDALANTGVDAIKFQTHIAEAESSAEEPFRVNFSYEDRTRYDYWKRMSFSLDEWIGIKEHCDEVGLEFMSSPFSVAAVALLEEVGIKRYKVGSGEVNNFLLLDRIAKTQKPIILSSGMSSLAELKQAVAFVQDHGNPLAVLQCTTSYPTKPENLGLNAIQILKEELPDSVTIGFSDHSGNIYSGLAAVSLGAKILEFHVTFDQRMFGPDARSSLTIDQVSQLVEGVRFIDRALQNPVNKEDTSQYTELRQMFGKSLSVNADLPAGHTLSINDLESKKPAGMGIAASDYQSVLGKTLIRPKSRNSFLKDEDLSQ